MTSIEKKVKNELKKSSELRSAIDMIRLKYINDTYLISEMLSNKLNIKPISIHAVLIHLFDKK